MIAISGNCIQLTPYNIILVLWLRKNVDIYLRLWRAASVVEWVINFPVVRYDINYANINQIRKAIYESGYNFFVIHLDRNLSFDRNIISTEDVIQ